MTHIDALVQSQPGCLLDLRVAVLQCLLGRDSKAAASRVELGLMHELQEIMKVVKGVPVTVCLLHAPLTQLLPSVDDTEAIAELAHEMDADSDVVSEALQQLQASPPVLAVRGCRLANEFPSVFYAQVQPTKCICLPGYNSVFPHHDALCAMVYCVIVTF
jgi:hypothetical protein